MHMPLKPSSATSNLMMGFRQQQVRQCTILADNCSANRGTARYRYFDWGNRWLTHHADAANESLTV